MLKFMPCHQLWRKTYKKKGSGTTKVVQVDTPQKPLPTIANNTGDESDPLDLQSPASAVAKKQDQIIASDGSDSDNEVINEAPSNNNEEDKKLPAKPKTATGESSSNRPVTRSHSPEKRKIEKQNQKKIKKKNESRKKLPTAKNRK